MGRDWTNKSVPTEMVDKIKLLIEKSEVKAKYGYGTPSEFIRRVVSDKILELEKEVKV